jgi:hypothetical protein
MKTMVTLILMMFGTTAFAGDSYFICSHVVDTTTEEEQFVVDASLDEPSETIHAIFQVPSQPTLLYQVSYQHMSRQFTASVKSFKSVKPLDQMTTTLEYGRRVQLSEHLSCFISD